MFRPLVESIYDYRMLAVPESLSARNTYKHHYLEACAFIASDHLLSTLANPTNNL